MISLRTYAQRLSELLDEQADSLSDSIAKGSCADFPAYREKVGRYKQIRDTQYEITDLLKKMETDDD